jgi:tetratricopeptide (TPR) repeat protein
MNKDFQHALILLEQKRYDLAEEKLRLSLADAPDHAWSHALLAHCLCERERLDEATAAARMAIDLDPELAEGHAVLSKALCARNHFDTAEEAIQEALHLEPENADHHAQRAAIAVGRRDWAAALAAAEQGLEQDAEHLGCNNLRAMALVHLGRRAEAGATMATALARDPENAFSHANQGWTYLHEGKRREALEHFREALRLDPSLDFARAGMVEALKSKNWIYALLLRYFLWMARWSDRAQWAIILGGYIGYQALGALARDQPALAPWVRPLMAAYLIFAISTWIAPHLFNLLLRLDRYGRHALSREQTVASNWIGALLAVALVCGTLWICTDDTWAILGTGYFGLLVLPVSGIFICDSGWPRRTMLLYTLALAAVGIAWLPLGVLGIAGAVRTCVAVFMWGCVLSGFVANYLGMQTPRR